MSQIPPLVDIHCHMLPGIDDGAKDWKAALAMARIAVADGIRTVVVTPHQLGSYSHNMGDDIRHQTAQLQQFLRRHGVPLHVLPGADVRIDSDMIARLKSGDCLTLADRGRHVLLELPHELYMPLEPVLKQLAGLSMVGILSHPERNQGLLRRPDLVEPLVRAGCLMQITADSLIGTFGSGPQEFSESLLRQGLVHFISSDAHSPRSRRPLLRHAMVHAAGIVGEQDALTLCSTNPAAVALGGEVRQLMPPAPAGGMLRRLFRKAAA